MVQSSDLDTDGISIGADALTLNGGTVRISGGNANASLNLGAHAISNSANHKVDGSVETAPVIQSYPYLWSRPASGDTYEFGQVIGVTVRFSRAVEVGGAPQLALTIGSAIRQASYFLTLPGSRSVAFQYVIQAADTDPDGVSVGANALTLNGGTIKTRGGSANATLSLGSYAITNSARRKVDGSRALLSH